MNSVSQIKDVKSTDTYFVNLQSLTERYGIKIIDVDNYFRASKSVTKKELYNLMNGIFNYPDYPPVVPQIASKEPLTRGEFVAVLNELLDRANERISASSFRKR